MSVVLHFIKVHSIFKYAGVFPRVIANFQDAFRLADRFHIKSEIIGEWLYCFTTPLIGFQLELLGFWFSFKHGAYIYNGREKDGSPDTETLDEIRQRLGSFQLKEIQA